MHHISAKTTALGGTRWLDWKSRDTKSMWTANLTPSSRPDCDLFFCTSYSRDSGGHVYGCERGRYQSLESPDWAFQVPGKKCGENGSCPSERPQAPQSSIPVEAQGQTVLLRGTPGSGAGDGGWLSNPEMTRNQA